MFEDSTHGGRQRNRAGCVGTHHFNSRPHGGRPFFFDCVPILPYFNSRPHGGRRFGLPDEVPFDYISTHALTEGDPDFFLFIIVNCISTHALTEGDVERVSGISVPPFQLTPSRRATSCCATETTPSARRSHGTGSFRETGPIRTESLS